MDAGRGQKLVSVIPSTTIGGGGLNSLKNISYPCIYIYLSSQQGFPCGSADTESTCNAGDLGLIPGLGRFPLQKGKATHSSILAWRIPWSIVHGVAKSWTRLSNFHKQPAEPFSPVNLDRKPQPH